MNGNGTLTAIEGLDIDVGAVDAYGKRPVVAAWRGLTHRDLFDPWDDQRRYHFAKSACREFGVEASHRLLDEIKTEVLRVADEADARNAPSSIEYQTLTLADLRDAPNPKYFIPGILERSQPGVIAGQYKSLKTTIAVELGYCLATGASFLNQFAPIELARVGMFSGEAGPAQLRGLVRRVGNFHGDDDPWRHEGLIFSCEKLPKIGQPAYMEALVRWIDKNRLGVAIIDPGYAALSAIGNGAGNYYMVAELLFQVTELQRQTGCVMLLAPHMTKAPKYDPPMLSDIQWSGFGEWAGQWLLLGKRREWDDATGNHWLWFVAGGRSGHASTWGLDVREGKQEDVGGKVFEPTLIDKETAFGATVDAVTQQRERQQQHKQTKEEVASIEAIRKAFAGLGDGCHIKAKVIERTGTTGKGRAMVAAWAKLLADGEIECVPGACRGGKNFPCDGYQITRKD